MAIESISSTSVATAHHNYDELAAHALKITFLIGIVIPALLFGVCALLRETGTLPNGTIVPYETLSLLFYILLFVAVTEVGAAFIVRKTLFSPERIRRLAGDKSGFSKLVRASAIVLGALGASTVFYGIILYMLGADPTRVAVFALFALICFRLLRPSAEFLRASVERAST